MRSGSLLFALASVIGALAWSQPGVDGSDLWWHLAAGRAHAESGALPKADLFSHTARGAPWINHEWLWGRAAWTAYRGHEELVAWLQLALIAATFALVTARAQRVSGSWLATCAITWLVAATSYWFLDVRPQVVTLFFTALLLATLEWRHAPWLWPPVLALWANLHGGFLFGIGVLGLHALAGSLRARSDPGSGAQPLRVWLGLGAAALAACANPWGPRIYEVPFQTLNPDTPFRVLFEWRPTEASLDPSTYSGRFAWMLVVAATGLIRKPRDPFAIVLALITALMAVRARRFIPLFAIVAAPLAASGARLAADALRRRFPVARTPLRHALAGGIALLVALALWRDVRLLPHLLQRWTVSDRNPTGAAAYLEAMAVRPSRLFALYEWGGYLMLHARSVPIFIDGRAGTVYPDQVARDYVAIEGVQDGWRQRLDAYRVDAVLVEPGVPLARALMREDPPWRVAHADARSMLLLPAGVPAGEEQGLEGADLHVRRAFLARQQGRLPDWKRELELAQEIDPIRVDPYRGLVLEAARSGQASEIRRWVDVGLDAEPRNRNQLWMYAAEGWRALGDAAAEADALRRVEVGGPFFDDELRTWIARRIRKLDGSDARTPNAR